MKVNLQGVATTRRGGFTLVEILVAATITLVLLGALISITSSVADTWIQTNSGIETGVEGRVAFEVLTRDLQSAVFKPGAGGSESFHMTYDTGLGAPTTTGKTAWLVFFAPPADRELGEPGDICAISYRLSFQDPIAASGSSKFPIFGLYRSIIPAKATFDDVLGVADLMTDYWTPNSAQSTNRKSLLCVHVVDFKITLRYRDPAGGLIVEIPGGEDVRISDMITSPHLSAPIPRGALESMEVTLSILSEQGVRLAEEGILPMDDLIRRFGSTFVRNIHFLQI